MFVRFIYNVTHPKLWEYIGWSVGGTLLCVFLVGPFIGMGIDIFFGGDAHDYLKVLHLGAPPTLIIGVVAVVMVKAHQWAENRINTRGRR